MSSAVVWSSGSLAVLLRARELALTRREEWERWAVDKHGSLSSACSNPRVKVPKLEDLLVEEWATLRPNQAGISAWTLNSHLKKFENLKTQLVTEQAEARRLRELRAAPPPQVHNPVLTVEQCTVESVQVVCHPNTDIPVFSLAELTSSTKLPAAVVQLVATRQRAKLASAADPQLHYLILWANQWEQETGERVSGLELQRRLHRLQARPSIRNRLKQFIVTSKEDVEKEQNKLQEEIDLDRFEFEAPRLASRHSVFPEVADDLMDVLVRWRGPEDVTDYEDENLVEVIGHSTTGIPIVTEAKEIIEEVGIKLKPKLLYLQTSSPALPQLRSQDEAGDTVYACPRPDCLAEFNNYNNLASHAELHRLQSDQQHLQSFGQRMATHRLCANLVIECCNAI